jgi:hypothetical protein
MNRLVLALGFIAALSGAQAVRADVPPLTASYVAGWNMVGGPPGTDLSSASILETWTSSQYVIPPVSITQACQGYWAYFQQPTTVTLPSSSGPTQTCALQAGWNIVGNPFSGQAQLPPGMVAWYWNPSRGAYDNVTAIPPGGSVWIISDTPSSITLTYASATPPRVPTTTELDYLQPGPITLHVGDSIKLNLPLATLYRATVDPSYLHLDTAGESGDLSCLNDPSCAGSLLNQFWIWHAVAPGYTTIMVTPLCVSAGTCATAPYPIAVNILP